MRLTDARWIISLLEAHLKGETIQMRVSGEWYDMNPDDNYRICSYQQNYRIKPKVAEYRLYGYVSGPQGIYCAERNIVSQNARSHLTQVEKSIEAGILEWLTDWLPLPIKRYD